jgi:hypothetical protein
MKPATSFAIHLVVDACASEPALESVRLRGGAVLELDVAKVEDLDALERALIRTFHIPYPSRGFQSLIDYGSSLGEWMDSTRGFMLFVTGIDGCPEPVARQLVAILPFMIDRWRSIGIAYDTQIVATTSRSALLDELRSSNSRLKAFGELPDRVVESGPVPVYVDGVLDEAASAGARPPS